MREHNMIEVCSMEQASKAASKDAAAQSSNAKKYVEDNTLTYYILINTWVMIWKNFAPHAWLRLFESILNNGLIPTIDLMQKEAMLLIKEEAQGPWAKILFAELRFGKPVIDFNLIESAIGNDELATVLFLLRYPKRFSPSGNDRIKEATLKDFLQWENRTKQLQRRTTFGYLHAVEYMRGFIRDLYPWDDIVREIKSLTPSEIQFSNGTARDAGGSALGLKVICVATDGNRSEFVQPIFGVYTLARGAAYDPRPRVSTVVAVPKSYKSSRIIAMEDTYPNAMGKAIEKIFRKYDVSCNTGIHLDDQGVNQEYARFGSETGQVATLDASHASDLFSKSLFCDLFPADYVNAVRGLLPDFIEITVPGRKEKEVRPLQMSSTSGHTLTFRHETIVYRAAAEAAVAIGENLGIPISHRSCVAYGDDTGVPVEVYDIAVYLFERIGLVINTDKSFATGKFRESCGKDYFGGVDVTSIYYPRFPVVGKASGEKITLAKQTYWDDYRGKLDNALTMLIDLQKKLYPYSYDCARFLSSIVQTAYPGITTSVAGEVCNDLWDVVDSGTVYEPKAWRLERKGKYLSDGLKATPIGAAVDQLHGENQEVFRRLASLDTFHKYPQVAFESNVKELKPYHYAYYEYWKYHDFLRNGPRYEDEFLKCLGISQAPMSIGEFYGQRTLTIARKR